MPPPAASRIYLYGIGGDAISSTWSTIATRSQGGLWQLDEVMEIRWSLRLASYERRTWTLAAGQGDTVDQLLADPCLRLEPDMAYTESLPWAPGIWIEIATPDLKRVSYSLAVPAGKLGQLQQLLNRPQT